MVRIVYESDSIFLYLLKGNVDDDLIFEYGEGVDIYMGCGATLMDEMWYFGGRFRLASGFFQNRQVRIAIWK